MDTALLLWQKNWAYRRGMVCSFNLEEAIQLHEAAWGNMLILGYTPPQEAARLHEMNISQTVFSLNMERVGRACGRSRCAGENTY
ncbi:MAG: alanine racemase [Acutalibacteraceae bacterium]